MTRAFDQPMPSPLPAPGTPLPAPMVCPATHRPLRWAKHQGKPCVETQPAQEVDAGGIRYPVEGGIPVLIVERGEPTQARRQAEPGV